MAPAAEGGPSNEIARPATESLPLVSFLDSFAFGSAHDPKGKEGSCDCRHAAKAAPERGLMNRSSSHVSTRLPQLAVDKEMTAFNGTTHLTT
jgi:hypothetical protein